MALKKFNLFLRDDNALVIVNQVIDRLRTGANNSLADVASLVNVGGGYDADFECIDADLEACRAAVREVMERERVGEADWRFTVVEDDED